MDRRQLDEVKTREIEAVAFAFHHDDGQNTQDLHRAEIVLVGVSRSMKTPTMLYLASRGWFAANVPLIPGASAGRRIDGPAARTGVLSHHAIRTTTRTALRSGQGGSHSHGAVRLTGADCRGKSLRRRPLLEIRLGADRRYGQGR